jgi:hypothetical protein
VITSQRLEQKAGPEVPGRAIEALRTNHRVSVITAQCSYYNVSYYNAVVTLPDYGSALRHPRNTTPDYTASDSLNPDYSASFRGRSSKRKPRPERLPKVSLIQRRHMQGIRLKLTVCRGQSETIPELV